MKTIRFVLLAACAIAFIVRADTLAPIDDIESYVNIRGTADSTASVVGRLQQGQPAWQGQLPLRATVIESLTLEEALVALAELESRLDNCPVIRYFGQPR